MTQEELQLIERARKALSEVRTSGHNLKALGFVLRTLDSLVENSLQTEEGVASVH
jgi:hypothetical protein